MMLQQQQQQHQHQHQHYPQQQQQPAPPPSPSPSPSPMGGAAVDSQKAEGDAPPKQVALAMERLGQAARLIADVRLGADRFLEALLAAADPRLSSDPDKPLRFLSAADSSMRQHLCDLRTLGRQLEESGVLNQSLRSRGDSWGLHMPLVCPDSTVVAYAWKRQLAGQAGASAVDRTRLALRAFTEQKKRFFPHLEEMGGHLAGTEFEMSKRHCSTQIAAEDQKENHIEIRTLSDVLTSFEKESPNVKIFTYQRLDWFKRASSLSPSSGNTVGHFREHNVYSKSRPGPLGSTSMDQVAVIELFVPFVFRAVLSLHPAGSVSPASMAFFSPDEGGNYIHSRGSSVHNVFKHITDHAGKALQYFQSAESDKALHLLLHWINGYCTLFTKVCSKCRRLIAMDRSMGLLLPPVYHPFQQRSTKLSLEQSTILTKELPFDQDEVYHFACYSNEQ